MAHTCAGRVFCTHVFRQGFGRPHSRARVKEARPLFCLQKKMEIKMNKLIMASSFAMLTGFVIAQQAVSQATTQLAAAKPVVQQAEVKVEPGAVLMAWKGKNMMEADIAAKIDTEKAFNSNNITSDPVARATRDRICKWSGILNIQEPGLYTFSAVGYGVVDNGTLALLINGTPIVSFTERNGTASKNVQLPGPVNLDIVMYTPFQVNGGTSILIRFKKAGTLSWTVLTPEMLMHQVQ